jgi:hypothetical protein
MPGLDPGIHVFLENCEARISGERAVAGAEAVVVPVDHTPHRDLAPPTKHVGNLEDIAETNFAVLETALAAPLRVS